jgi:hypothetical protein
MTHTGAHHHNPQGRLDRIYIPASLLNNLQGAEVLPSFSDHAIVSTHLFFNIVSSYRYRKLNNNILKNNDFRTEASTLLGEYVQNINIDFRSYELLKFTIKKLALECEASQKFTMKNELRNIQARYSSEHTSPKELFLQMVESEGSGMRHLDPDVQTKRMSEVRDGISLNTAFAEMNKEDRLVSFYEYYKSMLKKDILGYEDKNEFLGNLPQVPTNIIAHLESDFELDEIEEAISSLQAKSCPGLDGITAEFYKMFKEKMSQILKELWDSCLSHEVLPRSLRQGIVSLIFKNKGDPKSLKNWRPITMSNCDFKIYAIVIKNRLASTLRHVIGPWQTCGVPGRSIFDNLSFLRDNLGNGDGALLSLDQENAFGNVDHIYMLNVLKAFGYPNRFVDFIKIMYKSNFVHINTGLSVTRAIPLEKGVKQGDPMASSLS